MGLAYFSVRQEFTPWLSVSDKPNEHKHNFAEEKTLQRGRNRLANRTAILPKKTNSCDIRVRGLLDVFRRLHETAMISWLSFGKHTHVLDKKTST